MDSVYLHCDEMNTDLIYLPNFTNLIFHINEISFKKICICSFPNVQKWMYHLFLHFNISDFSSHSFRDPKGHSMP